jgi:transcriptional regulator with XRE-family HTH domain
MVDRLFQTHRKPDGSEYSSQEVSRLLKQRYDEEIDGSYIAKVRRGQIKNPGRDALKQLCLFFEVPASYFFPELAGLEPANAPEPNIASLFRRLPSHVQDRVEALIAVFPQEEE